METAELPRELAAQITGLVQLLKADRTASRVTAHGIIPFFQLKAAYKPKEASVQNIKVSWHVSHQSQMIGSTPVSPAQIMLNLMVEMEADIKIGAPQEMGMEKAAQKFLQKQRGQ